jgi:hypothetical protein
MHKEQYRNILVDIRKALKEQFVIEDSLLASESEALFFQKQPDKKPLMASLSVPVVPPLPAREKISSVEKQVPPPKEEQIKIAPIPEPSKPTRLQSVLPQDGPLLLKYPATKKQKELQIDGKRVFLKQMLLSSTLMKMKKSSLF